jgi:hypothetical protein
MLPASPPSSARSAGRSRRRAAGVHTCRGGPVRVLCSLPTRHRSGPPAATTAAACPSAGRDHAALNGTHYRPTAESCWAAPGRHLPSAHVPLARHRRGCRRRGVRGHRRAAGGSCRDVRERERQADRFESLNGVPGNAVPDQRRATQARPPRPAPRATPVEGSAGSLAGHGPETLLLAHDSRWNWLRGAHPRRRLPDRVAPVARGGEHRVGMASQGRRGQDRARVDAQPTAPRGDPRAVVP